MLAAINGDRAQFTTGEYNVLRLIAAYPLDSGFDSGAVSVVESLEKDNHPLATLPHEILTSGDVNDPHITLTLSVLNKGPQRNAATKHNSTTGGRSGS